MTIQTAIQTSEARENIPMITEESVVVVVQIVFNMAGDSCKHDLKEINHDSCKEIDIFEASQCG